MDTHARGEFIYYNNIYVYKYLFAGSLYIARGIHSSRTTNRGIMLPVRSRSLYDLRGGMWVSRAIVRE